MEKTIDVMVSGHLCLDLLPNMEHIRLGEIAMPGHLFEIGAMSVSTGGAVSNTGLALQRLGINVRLMSNVGDDSIGHLIVQYLESRDKSLADYVRIKVGRPSSYTIVLSPEKVDRIFLHCTGTNSDFNSGDVDYEAAEQARIFHLGYPPLLPGLLTDDGAELLAIFSHVWKTGTITSLDMTLPDTQSPSGQVDYRRLLAHTLPYVDIFIPSIKEILFMLKRDDFDRWHGNVQDALTTNYLDALAEEILAMGAAALVGFKLGERGIYLRTGNAERFQRLKQLPIQSVAWANRHVWHPAFTVDVVGTTGAGDAAYAGILASLLRGLSLDETARMACAVGACCVEAADATTGVLSWDETRVRIARGWQTLHQTPLMGD